MAEQTFTPAEANRRLPLIRQIVRDILEKGQQMQNLAEGKSPQTVPVEFYQLQEDMIVLMEELESLGCYYKDWDFSMGLVDFPAVINGEDVFLCWRSDEKAVEWYHSTHEGYASRKPIPHKLLAGNRASF